MFESNITMFAEDIYNSRRIEGKLASIDDTTQVLEGMKNPNSAAARHHKVTEEDEITAYAEAISMVFDNLGSNLDSDFLLELHSTLCQSDGDVVVGTFKNVDNFSVDSNNNVTHYVPAHGIERVVEKLCDKYNNSDKSISDIAIMACEFIIAHPFQDGNGRMQRLLINWALMGEGYPPVIIPVDQRAEYINTLKSYGKSQHAGDFIEYLEERVVAAITKYREDNEE
jgi:Fic family protein